MRNFKTTNHKSQINFVFRVFNLFGIWRLEFGASRHGGQALLTTVVFFLIISGAAVFAVSTVALSEVRSARGEKYSSQAYILAESGAEDMAYRVRNNKIYSSSETLVLNGMTTVTTVTTVGASKEIVARGDAASRIRSVKTVLSSGTGSSFIYGVQIGNGGLVMENTAQVNGSAYSNGPISGQNSPIITGDAFAAGTSGVSGPLTVNGHVQGYSLSNIIVGKAASSTTSIVGSTVGQHAWADTVSGSTIGWNAYYKTSVTDSTVGWQQIQISSAPVPLSTLSMPISDAELDTWEQEAAAGGTVSAPCPYKPVNDSSLGPVVINCDLDIDGTKTVTLTGAVWVKGKFSMENTAVLRLSASFGGLSGLIIADNPANRTTSSYVEIENTVQILGSGQAGSYIMIASRNNSAETGGVTVAADIKNSSSAAIYYAPHGEILLQNSVQLKEATAWRMRIKNSAQVTYESGLANVQFSSGPSGGWQIQTWREAQ